MNIDKTYKNFSFNNRNIICENCDVIFEPLNCDRNFRELWNTRTPEAGKLVALDEEHIAKYYYEEYIEQVHATPALSGAKFDPWEQLPLDDKMRIAFIIPARKFCARFGSQPKPSHEIIGIKANAILDSISDKMVGPIDIPSKREIEKVIMKWNGIQKWGFGDYDYCSLTEILHDELKKWMEK